MELLGSVFGFIVAPFIFWWSLSLWVVVPSAIAFIVFIGAMSEIDDQHPGFAFVALIIFAVLLSLGAGYVSDVSGFWPSIFESLKFFVKFIVGYIACGIITLIPLWYINVRRITLKNKSLFHDFISFALKNEVNEFELKAKNCLTESEKDEIRRNDGVVDGKIMPCLRHYFKENGMTFSSVKPKDNLKLIRSLIFVWFAHLIIEFFGELIAKIPEYVARILRIPLNWASRIASRGLPEDLR